MLGRTRFSRRSAIACTALALAAAACNRDSATTGPSGSTSKDFAANLRLVSGDQQLGAMGSALSQPIVVKVVDAGGQPVTGAAVTFSVRAGGGSINPAANVSDANGLVSSTWTMGTSLGENKAVALLTNQFLLDSAVFKATATTGPAAALSMVSGNNQTIQASRALPLPLSVRVRDAFGNNLSGVRVIWTPAASNGSVTVAVDTTAADGTANANWTLGNTATTQSLNATVTGIGTPVSFTAVATADSGRIFTVTATPPATASASSLLGNITVRVTDQYGNNVSGAAITWNDQIVGGGSLSATTGTTSATGAATTTWTLGRRLGTQSVRAKLTGRSETVTVSATSTVGLSDVIAGNTQACGISAATNFVYCWGAGSDGQLGMGGFGSSTQPTMAITQAGDTASGLILSARQVVGGRNGYCALTFARTLYCWGRQLGAAASGTPTAITLTGTGGASVFPNSAFMGEDFGCLIDLAGTAFCSGNNLVGQLGNGLAPTGTAVGTWVSLTAPAGAPLFASIATGRSHGCGIPRLNSTDAASRLATQSVYCWGLNNEGQVGNNTIVTANAPVTVTMPAGTTRFDSTTIVTGAQHSCAVEGVGSVAPGGGPGTAWCWGSNGFGQLGIGTTTGAGDRRLVPTIVTGGIVFAALYAGEHHTCGLTAAGSATCWGRNTFGQLGDGTTTNSLAPVAVAGGLAFRKLSLGETFTCGVTGTPGALSTTPGTVYCWGSNQFGQLGTGTTTNVLVPTAGRVLGQP